MYLDEGSLGDYFSTSFSGLLSFVAIGLSGLIGRGRSSSSNVSACFWGLIMAYNSRLCNLAAFLWAGNSSSNGGEEDNFSTVAIPGSPALMWAFIYLLFFIATTRILQGKANSSNELTKGRTSC